jgi:pimeloyl-ACP methyl ester carboxylesterase
MAKASNVILVHGAWADGSSWSKVIPLLLARSLSVTAVQLPLTSLKDDTATVRRALALQDGSTVLVGHSYGGVVITEAGNDPKVSALVYVAAFAPDAGQSVGSLGAGIDPAPMAAEVRPDTQGFLKLTDAKATEQNTKHLCEAGSGIVVRVSSRNISLSRSVFRWEVNIVNIMYPSFYRSTATTVSLIHPISTT